MSEAEDVAKCAKEVDSLLSRSKYKEAIIMALENPPFGSKEQKVKDMHTATVLKAISSLPDSDMEKVTDELYSTNRELCDNLVKYLYRGLQEGRFCGALLKWHAQVISVAGYGPIIRTMTDRKAV